MTGDWPFPFLRHGVAAAKSLHLWLALVDPTASVEPFAAPLAALSKTTKTRQAGAVLELSARSLALGPVEATLHELHASTPVGLVVRLNRVTPSAWHAASVAHTSAIVDVLERHVRAHGGSYLREAPPRPVQGTEDVGRLMRHALKGRAPLAELVASTLDTLTSSTRGRARLVLADQLLERLPRLLGFSFEVDLVLRVHLATLQQVSMDSVPMPARFSEAFTQTLRDAHATLSGHPGVQPAASWSDVAAVRAALARGALRELANTLQEGTRAHTETLLQLTTDERSALAQDATLATRLANAATFLLTEGHFADALCLYDAAVEGPLPPLACANPLFAVQDDNHHLGVDARRARRYLERCLPHGPGNPTIFLNAAFVFMELGEPDRALRALEQARDGGVPIRHHKNERLFEPVRDSPHFKALMR